MGINLCAKLFLNVGGFEIPFFFFYNFWAVGMRYVSYYVECLRSLCLRHGITGAELTC